MRSRSAASMTTLMLSPQQSADSHQLRKAALARNWNVVRWSNWSPPAGLDQTQKLLLYASPLFAERVSQLLNLEFPEPPDDWLVHLPQELLLREIHFSTLGEARQKNKRSFFKPAALKTFVAGVYENGEALPGPDVADLDQPVLISEVVKWVSEFRFFLRDGEALAGSVYFRFGESAEDGGRWTADPKEFEQAKKIAELAYAKTANLLPKSVVIDTGLIEGKGWAVIEANPSWGSGLYGSSIEGVLDVLEVMTD